MAESLQEWRVHIGAHKTATTHLQAVLESLKPVEERTNTRILPMKITRPAFRKAANKASGIRGVRDTLQLRFKIAPALRSAAQGADHVVASEEDILGYSPGLFEEVFYPDLTGLDLIPVVCRGGAIRLFLSIRSYDKILPSGFFETYKFYPDALAMLERGVKNLVAGRSGWPDLMDRIAQRLPEAEISFWCQEDYRRNSQAVIEDLLGYAIDQMPDIAPPQQTLSPNANALEEVERLDRAMPGHLRHKAVLEIYARHPAGDGPVPALVSNEASEELKAIYDRDVKIIADRFRRVVQ